MPFRSTFPPGEAALRIATKTHLGDGLDLFVFLIQAFAGDMLSQIFHKCVFVTMKYLHHFCTVHRGLSFVEVYCYDLFKENCDGSVVTSLQYSSSH